MLELRETTSVVTGVAGAGKSYSLVRWLMTSHLPELLESGEGQVITNLPLALPAIAEHFDKNGGHTAEAVASCVLSIPEDVESSWRAGESGPWEWLADDDLRGCVIILDEAHTVCGEAHSREHKDKWQRYCGELRHRGARIVFATQHPDKLYRGIRNEAGAQLSIVNARSKPDPFFGVVLEDWYQLRAAFTGSFRTAVWVFSKRDVDGRKVTDRTARWGKDPYWHRFYISHADPKDGGKGGRPREVFERLGRWGTVRWFAFRNVGKMVLSKVGACVLIWLLVASGGARAGFRHVLSDFVSFGRSAAPGDAYKGGKRGDDPPPPSAPEVPYETLFAIAEERTAEVVQLKRDLKLMADRLQEAEEAAREVSGVSMVATGAVGFQDGTIYRVGDVIRHGQYKGQGVVAIDPETGRVVLDSAELWLSRKYELAEPGTRSADLPPALSGFDQRSQPGASGNVGGPRSEIDAVRQRVAAGGSGGVPDTGGRGLGNYRSGVRDQTNHIGGPGRTSGNGAGRSGSAPGGRRNADGVNVLPRSTPGAGSRRVGASGSPFGSGGSRGSRGRPDVRRGQDSNGS